MTRPIAPPDNPIERFRLAHGLSNEQLCDRLGIARTHLSRLRHGKRGPSLQTALRIQERTDGEIPVEAWGSVAA